MASEMDGCISHGAKCKHQSTLIQETIEIWKKMWSKVLSFHKLSDLHKVNFGSSAMDTILFLFN